MNHDDVKNIIQGLGAITEMWIIVYDNFKKQGLNDETALVHTKALMSSMMGSMLGTNKEE